MLRMAKPLLVDSGLPFVSKNVVKAPLRSMVVPPLGAVAGLPLLSRNCTVTTPDVCPAVTVWREVVNARALAPWIVSCWVADNGGALKAPYACRDAVKVCLPPKVLSYSKLAELVPAAMVMLGLVSGLPVVSRNWVPVLALLDRLMVTSLKALIALPLLSCS